MTIFGTKLPRWASICILTVILFIGLIIYRYNWWTFVDSYELAYRYDKTTGITTVLPRTGWYRITPFMTEVHTVDMRPMQIRIEANIPGGTVGDNNVNTRVLNAMLVQFRAKGLHQFLSYHGRRDYDQKTLSEILKCYAYEGCATDGYSKEKLQEKYQFLEIKSTTSDKLTDTILSPNNPMQ